MAQHLGQHDPPANVFLNIIAAKTQQAQPKQEADEHGDTSAAGAASSSGGVGGQSPSRQATDRSPGKKSQQGQPPPRAAAAFYIPNTIVYTYSKAVAWFYTDDATGNVCRRPRGMLATSHIADECNRAVDPPPSLPRSQAPKACFVHIADDPPPRSYRVEAPDSAGDEDLLRFLQTSRAHGLLQHYVYDRTATDGSVKPTAASCQYTPSSFVVERLVARHTLTDRSVQHRHRLEFDTLSASGREIQMSCERQPMRSSLVASKFHAACEDAARRARQNGVLIKHLSVMCRVDRHDNLYILWCDALTAATVAAPHVLYVYTPEGMVSRDANARSRPPKSLPRVPGGGGGGQKQRGDADESEPSRNIADRPEVPDHVAHMFASTDRAQAVELGATGYQHFSPSSSTRRGRRGHQSTNVSRATTPSMAALSPPQHRSTPTVRLIAPTTTPLSQSRGGRRGTLPPTEAIASSGQRSSQRPRSRQTTDGHPSTVGGGLRPSSRANAATPTPGHRRQQSNVSVEAFDTYSLGGESSQAGSPLTTSASERRCVVCKEISSLGTMPRVQKRYLLLTLSLLDRSVVGWDDVVPPSVTLLHPTISYEEFVVLRSSDVWLDEFVPVCTNCVLRSNNALEQITRKKLPAPSWLGIDARYQHGHRQSTSFERPRVTQLKRRLEALLEAGRDAGDIAPTVVAGDATPHVEEQQRDAARASAPCDTAGTLAVRQAAHTAASSLLPRRRGGVEQASRFDPSAADIYDTTKGSVWRKVGFGRPHPADAYVPLAPKSSLDLSNAKLAAELEKRLQPLADAQVDVTSASDEVEVQLTTVDSEFPALFDLDRSTGHLPPSNTPINFRATAD